jgi:hypothetical protein
VLSDRLDHFWAQRSSAQAVNTLKEAYVSFRDGGTDLLDLGRINVREGVGALAAPMSARRTGGSRRGSPSRNKSGTIYRSRLVPQELHSN